MDCKPSVKFRIVSYTTPCGSIYMELGICYPTFFFQTTNEKIFILVIILTDTIIFWGSHFQFLTPIYLLVKITVFCELCVMAKICQCRSTGKHPFFKRIFMTSHMILSSASSMSAVLKLYRKFYLICILDKKCLFCSVLICLLFYRLELKIEVDS